MTLYWVTNLFDWQYHKQNDLLLIIVKHDTRFFFSYS